MMAKSETSTFECWTTMTYQEKRHQKRAMRARQASEDDLEVSEEGKVLREIRARNGVGHWKNKPKLDT